MQHTTKKTGKTNWKTRFVSLMMSVVMVLGMLPVTPAGAVDQDHWAAPYLEKMEEWGVMRESQLAKPDQALTRADFMAVVNRAYGYTEKGDIPFTDVLPEDWFYEDVCIAHKANYIHGTSETTASPNATLTRETAAFILGKNMMLKEVDGENVDFTDGRDVSSWSRGIVKAAVQNYLISGYDDNTFRPQRPVTFGEVATMISTCIGTPLNKGGDYTLGGVFGNVTITSSGVTLRDTTISGDLYITGGVGKGEIKLENVTVLGRIIDSGTGESEEGQVSVVMRNVIADELLVDNLNNNYVTLRTEGMTQIGKVDVRTNAYLEDNTPQNYGLAQIDVDGEEGLKVDLAGRIKNVTTKTPNSLIVAAKGTIQSLTVDEKAVGAQVQIDRSAEVIELNLDVGTDVTGTGDVEKLNVNAPGSTTTMLPDQIYIRPGLTAGIAGTTMDTAAAEESSRDPRILSGYPIAGNVAPTGLDAIFCTNKGGTVYWAVSTIADGSVEAEELINHPDYGSIAVKYGSVKVSGADVKVSAKVTGLEVGGGYYLSAVLVDGRGQQSPVKVTAFTTPDNTKPAFASGYPYMSYISDSEANATVMTTKSCKLYYAVLKKGAAAPTPNEFKTGSISGALGYNVMDAIKNTELDIFPVNNLRLLEEEVEYDLYLWLTDADGANSSNVHKLSFKTVDKTPPRFVVKPTVNKVQATSVGAVFTLNEAGTVYWVVVEEGASYPKPKPGESTISPDDDYAKLQVASGLNAIKSGKVSATANKEGTINITGLQAEKAYDLWYLGQDTAGNYTLKVEKLTIHTLDNSAPVVKQYFVKYSGTDNTMNPMPDTDIILEFSEGVRTSVEGVEEGGEFLALYEKVLDAKNNDARTQAKEELARALEASIHFYYCPTTGKPELIKGRENYGDAWIIDYRNATVSAKEGKISVTFPTVVDEATGYDYDSALNLASGATYYFELEDITDTSNSQNPIIPNPVKYDTAAESGHILPQFTTVFAEVFLGDVLIGARDLPVKRSETGALVQEKNPDGSLKVDEEGKPVFEKARVDFQFRMDPQSTEKVEEGISYDVLLFMDQTVAYDVYYRIVDDKEIGNDIVVEDPAAAENTDCLPAKNTQADESGWIWLGNSGLLSQTNGEGISVNARLNGCTNAEFPALNQLREDRFYDFAISLTQKGTATEFDTWSGDVLMRIDVAAGSTGNLYSLSQNLNKEKWQSYMENGLNHPSGAESIGITAVSKKYYEISQSFEDTATPGFANDKPRFEPGDTFVNMILNLDRKGTIYYVLAPEGVVITKDKGGNDLAWATIPEDGSDKLPDEKLPLKLPNALNIQDAQKMYANIPGVVFDDLDYYSENVDITQTAKGLLPQTNYCAYFVLKGASPDLSRVYVYRFQTNDVSKPKITLQDTTDGAVKITTHVEAVLDYVLYTEVDALRNPLLTTTFKAAENTPLPIAYQKKSVTAADGTVTERDITILEALLTTYDKRTATSEEGVGSTAYIPENDPKYANMDNVSFEGYSVFDIYATDKEKSQVAQLIRATSSSGGVGDSVVNRGTLEHTYPDVTVIQEMDKMETESGNYVLLTVAYHVESEEGTGDAFKAQSPIVKLDNKPPEFEDCTTALSTTTGPNVTKWSGSVTVNFDKPIYWVAERISGSSDAQPVYQVPLNHSSLKKNNAISVLQYLGGSATVDIGKGQMYASKSFTFTFEDLVEGDTIQLFTNGFISNANGKGTQKTLTLTMVCEKEKTDTDIEFKVPHFEAKWE